jgi:adenosylcobyric acid synthase
VIVLEGAGSPAEFNLRDSDIVNMRMAEAADARCVLVGDIDRGGVFASLLGTLALLEPHERARIAGFAINKFRGDVSLLLPGVAEFEKRIGLPCFGVIPYLRDVGLDEEDSVSFEVERVARRAAWSDEEAPERRLRIAVVALPHLANATDFATLRDEPGVELVFALEPAALSGADVVILPGTKTTLAARRWLQRSGFDDAIRGAHLVFGLCGGLQILGTRIDDPLGVEGGGTAQGLGLLSLATTFAAEKVTSLARGLAASPFGGGVADVPVCGYEIHMGETHGAGDVVPFARIRRGNESAWVDDGARSADGRIAGTYVHGIFDDDAFRHAFVRAARSARGLVPARELAALAAQREARLDRLAGHVRASLDLAALFGERRTWPRFGQDPHRVP